MIILFVYFFVCFFWDFYLQMSKNLNIMFVTKEDGEVSVFERCPFYYRCHHNDATLKSPLAVFNYIQEID